MNLTPIKYVGITLVYFCLFSCTNSPRPLFDRLPASQTGIDFINHFTDNDKPGILDYLYAYNGGGVAAGDINNDGLVDLFFTGNKPGSNRLYVNKGDFHFDDITTKANVAGTADWSAGVTMADVNNDGYLDIYVCAVSGKLGLKGHNMLYINQRNGTFTEESARYGLDFAGFSNQAAFFDADHDGQLDCFLLTQSDHQSAGYGVDTTLRNVPSLIAGSKFYLNRQGHFVDYTTQSGIYPGAIGYGLGIAVSDVNNDGWEDIYISNDFRENDYYYINKHNGTFAESGARHFNHYSRASMGNDIADFNNDGQLDIVTVDMLPTPENLLKTFHGEEDYDTYQEKIVKAGLQYQYSRNCLQKNLGNGQAFADVGLLAGVEATDWSWSPLLADFDDDGIKDLFITNGIARRPTDLDYLQYITEPTVQHLLNSGHSVDRQVLDKMPTGETVSYLYKGTKAEKFIDKRADWGITEPMLSNGAAYADLNNDGHLDLIVNNINREASIYRNTETAAHSISLKFTGRRDNRFGVGVKAYLFSGHQLQYQQLMLTRGFQSSVPPELHFGLGASTSIDSLLVVWPDQTFQVIKNLKLNQKVRIDQQQASGHFVYDQFFPAPAALFKEATAQLPANLAQPTTSYVDRKPQPFIPHLVATIGPRMAVADVNRDGLDDFYICGGNGNPGSLVIQFQSGKFQVTPQPAFNANRENTEADAVFLDANADGYPDLYVANGGSQYADGDARLADHLYINDGKGMFKSSNAIPSIRVNKSAIAAADVNRDGYMDLFLAAGQNPGALLSAPQAILLMNDRRGHYRQVSLPEELTHTGQMHTAAFADLNNDGWPDLVVAGEWMPVKVFMNKKGNLVRKPSESLDQRPGWWQRIILADVDKDGKTDIVAGNYGWNSRLKPTAEDPVKLFLTDLDQNGIVDPLLTYSIERQDYPLLGKDDLEKQIPTLKSKFTTYREFAGKTVQQVFGKAIDKVEKPLTATTFTSGVFYNDGKGGFTFSEFPVAAQVAPLSGFTVLPGARTRLIAGGNFYDVTPIEGRYDADYGNVLVIDKKRTIQAIPSGSSGFSIRGEVRDIKTLRTMGGLSVVVAFRNQAVKLFELQQ